MKRYLFVLILILSVVFIFCACKLGDTQTTEPDSVPSETSNGSVDLTEKETIDWETPIDVDDSFVVDPAPSADTPTDPSDETGPLTTVPTSDPTNPADPTDPSETETPTDDPVEPTEQVPTKAPGSSTGPIELPMIPG